MRDETGRYGTGGGDATLRYNINFGVQRTLRACKRGWMRVQTVLACRHTSRLSPLKTLSAVSANSDVLVSSSLSTASGFREIQIAIRSRPTSEGSGFIKRQ
jgi:hypothetical protein